MPAPTLLILGSGPRTGRFVADAFAARGYRVALAARSLKSEDSTGHELHITADFSDPSSIPRVFEKVQEVFGAPSVVVYTAGSRTVNNSAAPLAIDQSQFEYDFRVSTLSAVVAAELAVKGFATLPEIAARTFIYTGNFLNETPLRPVLGYAMCKSAASSFVHLASEAYEGVGYRFYYADEREEDGEAVFDRVSGKAAGKFYVQLVEGKTGAPWWATYVRGKGYVRFPRRERAKASFPASNLPRDYVAE